MNRERKKAVLDNSLIQVTHSSMPNLNEYIEEVKDSWESHWPTSMGVEHKELEEGLLGYLGPRSISLFANGHLALECITAALNFTGEVITTPFISVSTTHVIVRNGPIPVSYDISSEDYAVDVTKIKELMAEKASTIIPVHVYGNVCNIKEIERIAKKHNLKTICDAAHTFDVKVNGEGIASFGDVPMFSFHITKVSNTIEGGVATFSDESLRKKPSKLKNSGITGPESVEYMAENSKMNELRAAMGICNLRHVDEEISKRRIVVKDYNSRLEDVKEIKAWRPQEGIISNYACYPAILDNYKYNRGEVSEKLKSGGVIARKYFCPLTNSFNYCRDNLKAGETPIARSVSERVLTLPLYPDLSLDDVNKICDIILEEKSI